MKVYERPQFRREFEDWEVAYLLYIGKNDEFINTLRSGARGIEASYFSEAETVAFKTAWDLGWEAHERWCRENQATYDIGQNVTD